MTNYAYVPDYVVHPGEYLEEILESRGLKKQDFAIRVGLSVKHVSEIINKKKNINATLAVQFEKTLGVSANIWNNLNADYELFMARSESQKQLEGQVGWIRRFPISNLKKLGFLPSSNKPRELLVPLLQFFGAATPEQWEKAFEPALAHYRKSATFKGDDYHLSAWLRAGELLAQSIQTRPYSKDLFLNNLEKARNLTKLNFHDFKNALRHLCSEAGVALVFVPEFGKTHISGATYWLTSEKAILIMSLRHKWNDHFWFTFFHEAAHILKHPKKETFIDSPEAYESELEEDANRFSRSLLIPDSLYESFLAHKDFYPDSIMKFARKIDVHPGIVVGRLQHDKYIKHNWHNNLRERYQLNPDEA